MPPHRARAATTYDEVYERHVSFIQTFCYHVLPMVVGFAVATSQDRARERSAEQEDRRMRLNIDRGKARRRVAE